MVTKISQEIERPSILEDKITKSYMENEGLENEQLEITAMLKKIQGISDFLPPRKYGQRWKDLKFGICLR